MQGKLLAWPMSAALVCGIANAAPVANQRTIDIAPHTGHFSRTSSTDGATAVKHDEHAAALQLVRDSDATHLAIHSGAWSDPRAWRDSEVPATGARVVIAKGISIRVDGKYDAVGLDWIRVDGVLRFA